MGNRPSTTFANVVIDQVGMAGVLEPIDERAMSAHIFHAVDSRELLRTFHAVGRAVLESASPGFQARRYTISATDPTKKARCPYDTGLSVFLGILGQVSQTQWIIGEQIRRMTGELFSRYPSFCDT